MNIVKLLEPLASSTNKKIALNAEQQAVLMKCQHKLQHSFLKKNRYAHAVRVIQAS